MDAHQFDDLLRTAFASRRTLLGRASDQVARDGRRIVLEVPSCEERP